MRPPSVFTGKRNELESAEFQYGVEAGRLAVALDLLTDSLILVGQHGVYCQSARQPGKPAMDLQLILEGIGQSKELVLSVMDELRRSKPIGGAQP
jgi:hypothetical protein